MRKRIKEERAGLNQELVNLVSESICKNFLETDMYKHADVIGVYMSFQNEVDLTKIIQKSFEDKKRVCIPVTEPEIGNIYFAEIFQNDKFLSGAFGIREPESKKKIDINDVDLVMVPGLAFDFCGARVGFGKGFYDKLLEKSKAVLVGVGYRFQLFEDVECYEHDKRMNCIVTEEGLIDCEKRFREKLGDSAYNDAFDDGICNDCQMH